MRHSICAVAKRATQSRSCYKLSPNPASQSPLTSTCSCARVQCKGRYPDTSAIAKKDDVGGHLSSRPSPLRGAAQWLRQWVKQGQVSDHPSKATKTKKGVSGWTYLLCHVKRERVAGTAKLVSTTSSEDMLAITVNFSPIHACRGGAKAV